MAHWLFGRSPNRHCSHRRGANHGGRRTWGWNPLWQIPSFIISALWGQLRKPHLFDYRHKWTVLRKEEGGEKKKSAKVFCINLFGPQRNQSDSLAHCIGQWWGCADSQCEAQTCVCFAAVTLWHKEILSSSFLNMLHPLIISSSQYFLLYNKWRWDGQSLCSFWLFDDQHVARPLTSTCVTSPGLTLTGPKPTLFSQILWEFTWRSWSETVGHSTLKWFCRGVEIIVTEVMWSVKTNLADWSRASMQQVLLLLVAEHWWWRRARRKPWTTTSQITHNNYPLQFNWP